MPETGCQGPRSMSNAGFHLTQIPFASTISISRGKLDKRPSVWTKRYHQGNEPFTHPFKLYILSRKDYCEPLQRLNSPTLSSTQHVHAKDCYLTRSIYDARGRVHDSNTVRYFSGNLVRFSRSLSAFKRSGIRCARWEELGLALLVKIPPPPSVSVLRSQRDMMT